MKFSARPDVEHADIDVRCPQLCLYAQDDGDKKFLAALVRIFRTAGTVEAAVDGEDTKLVVTTEKPTPK